jgi:transcriptional regulator NrdR family protein
VTATLTEDPTQQRCPACESRMKLMETRKNDRGDVRRRFACLRGCGKTLHTVQHAPFRLAETLHV